MLHKAFGFKTCHALFPMLIYTPPRSPERKGTLFLAVTRPGLAAVCSGRRSEICLAWRSGAQTAHGDSAPGAGGGTLEFDPHWGWDSGTRESGRCPLSKGRGLSQRPAPPKAGPTPVGSPALCCEPGRSRLPGYAELSGEIRLLDTRSGQGLSVILNPFNVVTQNTESCTHNT